MATASKQTVKTPVVTTTYVETETVTLVLTKDEAETLLAVTTRIGGSAETTRRVFMDSIRIALRAADVKAVSFSTEHDYGRIYFSPESK